MKRTTSKNPALSWKVLHYDFNSGEIVFYDILDHGAFLDDVREARRKCRDDAEFLEKVRGLLRYYFWSKCEYEIAVSGLFPRKGEEPAKIDAFDQVEANWDAFSTYLLEGLG